MTFLVLKSHDWQIKPAQDNAAQAYLVTAIYPMRADVAIVVTNSLSGVRLDQWLIFERFMVLIDDTVHTRMSFIDNRTHMTEALDVVRKFGIGVYGVDISLVDVPF